MARTGTARSARKGIVRHGAETIRRHSLPMCPGSGKVRYRDAHQAKHGLDSCKWRRADDLGCRGTSHRDEIRSYKCPDCRGYHLTSRPIREREVAFAGAVA